MSSKQKDDQCTQPYQFTNEGEVIDDIVRKDSSASPPSNEHSANAQLLPQLSSIQNLGIVNVSKSDMFIDKKTQHPSKAEQRTPMQNGSGQKLESIIGRLSSDKVVTALIENDEDALICKADASTQTFPDFVKVINFCFHQIIIFGKAKIHFHCFFFSDKKFNFNV